MLQRTPSTAASTTGQGQRYGLIGPGRPASAVGSAVKAAVGQALEGARRSLRSSRVQLAAVVLLALALLGLALLGLALLGSETGNEYCLRSYRTTERQYRWAASWHNRLARALHSVRLCDAWHQQTDCKRFGGLLDEVEIYIIEMPSRAGRVRTQASASYGVPKERVHTVPATTPDSGGCQTLCPKIAAECQQATVEYLGGPDLTDDYRKWPAPGERPRPFKVTAVHMAVAWSHLAAIRLACKQRTEGSKNNLALVLEDDADFGPLEHWPAPLSRMIKELPNSWTVLNVAPSNPHETGTAVSQALTEGRIFRQAHMNVTKYAYNMDYGAVAVLYNLGNPAVCHAVEEDPHTVMRKSEQICEPADLML
eukprot:COSAG01_NODE_1227_length_11135_cov_33.369337_7_plen_367_part_00